MELIHWTTDFVLLFQSCLPLHLTPILPSFKVLLSKAIIFNKIKHYIELQDMAQIKAELFG